ncbi:glycosyltransferase family 1 protein [Parerythrobacter aurantius]|uniref:glycosyltransferase family 4 protein n=1 Tax=Parerythrobacter aurantius TaxID=3127706 RepID=UPI00324EB92C
MHRIVYDHRIFTAQKYGGISRYFCELAERMDGLAGLSSLIVAPLHGNAYLPDCKAPQWAMPLPGSLGSGGRAGRVANRLASPLLEAVARPSLVHHTYYSQGSRTKARTPSVLTVFDMIHELFPADFPAADPTSIWKRANVAAADHVICISHSTARDLQDLCDVPADKITVTHLACSEVFAEPPLPDETSPHGRPYVLYVGNRGGYKNFENAVRAYAMSERLRREFDFVAFGGSPRPDAAELALLDSLALPATSIVRLGGSDDDLARAYRHARVFIYPSRYEGFGIPPLEAMTAGGIVACSRASSIPEVVGDAALMFDPDDVDDICRQLETACFDEAERAVLKTRSEAQARRFSWDRCARETADAYRELLA